MRYYVVGYMYSGKSTFGRQLAEAEGMHFVDLDQLVEERYRHTIADLFARYGEAAFRQLESQALRTTADMDNVVVATGGGTPCHADNMDFILAHGTAIYLRLTPEQLLARSLASRKPRPLMAGLDEEARRRKIEAQLAEREPYYRRAQVVLDGNSPQLPLH